jgi:hypothetical protein
MPAHPALWAMHRRPYWGRQGSGLSCCLAVVAWGNPASHCESRWGWGLTLPCHEARCPCSCYVDYVPPDGVTRGNHLLTATLFATHTSGTHHPGRYKYPQCERRGQGRVGWLQFCLYVTYPRLQARKVHSGPGLSHGSPCPGFFP